ncbi:uncharacterized protein LOC105172079 [Sesamum indicum]|uniref:Uncharacterized protein LOC105172079 n=1 Tax=Sesamum indicum TaxID=4182 RepID=A0A6I9UC44_SESIN|nr:uncharacterized protein LOC105172079 [Sesamum indicum]
MGDNAPVKDVIHTIAGGSEGCSNRMRKRFEREHRSNKRTQLMRITTEQEIMFGDCDAGERAGADNDQMVIKMDIANFTVHKVLVDNGSSADIIFREVLKKMDLDSVRLKPVKMLWSALEERKSNRLGDQGEITEKRRREDSSKTEWPKQMERIEPVDHKEIELVQRDPSKRTTIGSKLGEFENVMVTFLRKKVDMFAWDPTNLKGIDPGVIVHRLNVDPAARPVQQKKRTFGIDKNRIIEEEVNKLLKAGYVSEVQYTDWLANMVMVPKTAGKWRMCTDFTDLNKACPKNPYPLSRINLLVDSTAG